MALALYGCASPRPKMWRDPAFIAARQRLSRAEALAASSKATDAERAVFEQAESFYEYRPAFPGRGKFGFLAEMAAVVTDFPALQSLAGSTDIGDLRLKCYDGAINLWEGLLDEHPDSPLKPLTLYRLGWAYRNAGAEGLPRQSGNEAFSELRSQYPALDLSRLAEESAKVPWKSRSKATFLSLIPGGGQFYVGEDSRGLGFLGAALGSFALFAVPSILAVQRHEELTWDDWPLLAAATGGLVILSVDYTLAYQDSLRGVVQFNERKEAEFLASHPEAP